MTDILLGALLGGFLYLFVPENFLEAASTLPAPVPASSNKAMLPSIRVSRRPMFSQKKDGIPTGVKPDVKPLIVPQTPLVVELDPSRRAIDPQVDTFRL